SLNTLLGITKTKRKVRRSLGVSQVEAWTKPSRVKQRVKYRAGWYSPTARIIRNTAKGRFPTPFGLFTRHKKYRRDN
ncbi:MAG: hypothetical protein LC729_04635, partial [Acidobacteria bacterium]|nr:hypothetical protein [Acidobacteriota bacterium]